MTVCKTEPFFSSSVSWSSTLRFLGTQKDLSSFFYPSWGLKFAMGRCCLCLIVYLSPLFFKFQDGTSPKRYRFQIWYGGWL